MLAALPTTLELFVLSVAIGGVLALVLTWMRVGGNPVLDRIARAYILVFRGSPLLIQMFLVYYGLGQFRAVRLSPFWPVLRDPFSCAVISLALCTAAYTTEIFRGGLLAVPPAQIEAARACGMSGLAAAAPDRGADRAARRAARLFHRNRADGEIDGAGEPCHRV